jgi:hypothetical protein
MKGFFRRMQYTDIPLQLDSEKIKNQIKMEAYPELEPQVDELIDAAYEVAAPKALCSRSTVEKINADKVYISGLCFTSAVPAEYLKIGDTVFPYVATCGRELDSIDLSGYDMLSDWWLNIIKTDILHSALEFLQNKVLEYYGDTNLSSINPGSADVDVWPIEQQKILFSLLGDTQSKIGVELTESCLMIPSKSLSGIFFSSEKLYSNCQSCTREHCPSRKAEYRGHFGAM